MAFHAHDPSIECASNRLRMFSPMQALQRDGFDINLYGKSDHANAYDLIVFSRGFSSEALKIARAARAANRRIVVDMCDNLFALSQDLRFTGKCERLREMMAIADRVTAPTQLMAAQLSAHVPEACDRFRVVPDTLETLSASPPNRCAAVRIAALERFLAHHHGALHCVWYGSSAGNLSGFAHLDAAVAELERFSVHHPVTLTVISDTRLRYWLARRHWRIPTFYMPFDTDSFGPALARHDVAVIPVGRNGYTSGKSINRAATAVIAGLGVVADPLPSYEELRPWIALGDWQAGLARYVERPAAVDPALAKAQRHLEGRYGSAAVARQWADVLAEAVGP